MALEPGVVINHRYRILSILGQGGMGAVYRAMDLNLSVEVALKENLYLTEEYTRQFKREAAILATLRHPNLPKVTDHFEIPGQGQYLVMEFITGEDLRERMDRQVVLGEAEVVRIGSAICDALSYLHSRVPPVVHRDIKPGNIRITDDGNILLVDFGLAKMQLGSQETTSGARAMTPGYSPPEQYGTSRTDARSDIYALGATLYAALGGAAPEDSLSRATEYAKLTSIRSLNSKVSRKMTAVLEKALELRPEDRYQTADEMKKALLSVLGEKPLSKPITVAPPPLQRQVAAAGIRSDPAPIPPFKAKRPESPTKLALTAFFSTLAILAIVFIGLFVLDRKGILFPKVAAPDTVSTQKAGKTIPGENINPTAPLATAETPISIAAIENTSEEPTAALDMSQATVLPPLAPPAAPAEQGEIAFATSRGGYPQVWLMNGDGSDQHQLTRMKSGACQPDWSPDGNRIVFVSPCEKRDVRYPDASLFIINRDGSNLTVVDTGYGSSYSPAWSPDGNKIAFTKEISGFTQIYLLDLPKGTISAPVDDELPTKQAAWSPEGNMLAFIRTKYNTDHLWILDLISGASWQLSHTKNRNDSQPVWSSDGNMLFYTQSSIANYYPDMFGIPFDQEGDSVEIALPEENHPIPSPAADGDLSSDGEWMIFESWPDGSNHDIYKMNLKGDSVLRLTDQSRLDFQPVWKP